MNGWEIFEWCADPRHVQIITATLGLRRAEATKALSEVLSGCVNRARFSKPLKPRPDLAAYSGAVSRFLVGHEFGFTNTGEES